VPGDRGFGPEGIEHVSALLAANDLVLRGGFDFETGEDAPAKSVLLVGHGGAGYWPHFQRWQARNEWIADPLDQWSRHVIDEVATKVGARAVYPSDRPYLPFQQWAMRAEGLKPSPLGILMHPEFGLWHAYRGALMLDRPLIFGEETRSRHLCDRCREKPCLKVCPVGAFGADGYDVGACRGHVRADGATCREQGCIARNACPHDAYRYPAAVQAFHMNAFLRA
jgi:ferredoxin-like protein FixX